MEDAHRQNEVLLLFLFFSLTTPNFAQIFNFSTDNSCFVYEMELRWHNSDYLSEQ